MKDLSDIVKKGVKFVKETEENNQFPSKISTPYENSISSSKCISKKNEGNRNTGKKEIAIFVALEMERKILINSLGLHSNYPDLSDSGEVNSTNITLYCPNAMGRVPAAVSTMKFLSNHTPDLLIVAGIAGGFKQEGINIGDIIIAKSIADLASRKIKLDAEDSITIQEFRPKEFHIDKKLENYLLHKLDISSWEQEVLNNIDWPDGKRPTIHYGTLASLDEVISDDQWISKLLNAWPKLCGVEMEAGGVCAAASENHVDVAVIRGVSDLADPAKSDTQWRKIAMQTVGSLLRKIDFNAIFAVTQ